MDPLLETIRLLMMEKGFDVQESESLIQDIQSEWGVKKYGLVWENKVETVSEQLKTHLPYLTEVEAKRLLGDNGSNLHHLLMEGDNLEALTLLQTLYKGAVKICYIDPPYNTGKKDFVYNDHIVDKEDAYRHSKWLSFMEKRLTLAYDLLTDDGVMFISIDDNEMAQLKLLCDQIFGETNFINMISIKTKTSSGASGGGEDKKFKKNIEYLLVYTKERTRFNLRIPSKNRPLMDIIQEKRNNGKPYEYAKVLINKGNPVYFKMIQDGKGKEIKIYKHNDFIIKTIKELMIEEQLTEEEVYLKYFKQVFRTTNAQTSIRTRVNKAVGKTSELISISYTPSTGKNKGIETLNYYLNGDLFCWLSDTSFKVKNKIMKSEKLGTLWDDLSWSGIAKEGGVSFNNGKKPLAFIKRIINMLDEKDAIILDFFAGSGTTGHAVLELNQEDGGHRQFILCTNNENNICEDVTYKRLRQVVTGHVASKGKAMDGIPANLHYYKINLIPKAHNLTDNAMEYLSKGVELICIKENVFDLIKDVDYVIATSAEKAVLIYLQPFALGYEVMNIAKTLDPFPQAQKIIYATMTQVSIDGIEVKEYPQEILEQINRIQQRLKQWERGSNGE